jgi:hypothetical protein
MNGKGRGQTAVQYARAKETKQSVSERLSKLRGSSKAERGSMHLESRAGCVRMSRQRGTVLSLIVVYDVDIVHVQPSTWSKSPRSQHNCVAGRTPGGGHR